MRRLRFPLLVAAVVLVWGAGPAPPGAHAQALSFEEVGDRPIDATDLAFDDAGTLWASASELYRLSDDGVWEEMNVRGRDFVLPLGDADTVLVGGVGIINRSTDGGHTFEQVNDEGERLFELPSGTLIAGADAPGSVLRSTDRGATWAFADFDPPGTWFPFGEAFVGVPPGFPHAGRVAGAFWAGMAYSDDDGASWEPSNVFQNDGRYSGWDLAVGVDGRVYAAFFEVGVQGLQVAVSEDGGATYGEPYRFGVDRGIVDTRILALPGGADPEVGVVVVVQADGTVLRSDDAGATWLQVGKVPLADATHDVRDAAVGPDGRLYVGVTRAGPADAWVYRSEGPAVSAAVSVEAEPLGGPVEIGPEGGSFEFRVRLTNQTTQPLTFEGWSAVGGPVAREPVVGPQPVTLMPGQTVGRTVTQQVPARAPAGEYTYTVRAGELGGAVLSEASFVFEKAAGAAPSVGVEDWTASGWAEAEHAAPSAALTLSVAPNPSRGAATVTLSLPAPAEATVSVYDVLGRRVAVLHDGPLGAGHHTFALGGAALPPGVYVVRVEAGGSVRTARVTLVR